MIRPVSILLIAIREYLCSFMADILVLEIQSFSYLPEVSL